jgi:hypothetical protein
VESQEEKEEDSPSGIALTSFLRRFGNSKDKKDENPKVDKKKTASWKYDKTIDSNKSRTKSVDGTNKTCKKWCIGLGHGDKGMWVINDWFMYQRSPGFNNNQNTKTKVDDNNIKINNAAIQNLQAILKQAQPGNDNTTMHLVILQK